MGTIWPQSLSEAKGPKYKKVADTIRSAVDLGSLKTGAKLPPVRDLAYQLGITPGTVARAYSILTDEGVLEAEVGRGTFVAEKKKPVPDDVWSRQLHLLEARDPGHVSLFSPRIADMGQVAAMREALHKVAEGEARSFLNYPTRDAYLPVRQAAAAWVSQSPVGPVSESDVVLTHGGQNGLMVVLQAILTGPQPVIMVEDLTYAGFRRAAELLRAQVVEVAMDEHGIRPDSMELAIRKTGASVLCTSPEVHNPTGLHTPLERRKEIVRIARRHEVQIVEDDCYRLGETRTSSYRALAPELAWHVSSISKILTPALRVGFALAPEGRSTELRRAAEYGYFGLAQPLAELLRILLTDPRLPDLVAAVRGEMARYVRVAVNALGAFDLTWNPDVPFVWLRLPSGWRAAAFTRAAEANGVQIRSADEFALRDGRAPHAVRIAINAHVPLRQFEEAMLRLRALLDNPPEQISV
ncbi:PLP-dependent aminotransferase family protein [Leisingera methylohalidivorans]|uniref:Aspartate aminotransferase n=1 Tax=Leisingera methylohalidivorans DSM 14336 TaxID=999552 RepID=V9VTF0_9RHOB|nr:PLP-dependent aminotransferase family protein [Leisingera methylohalidivorans]AHD00979.1 aspartate aminotransferase [Leisingera methylohalidivorans DSM 14336]